MGIPPRADPHRLRQLFPEIAPPPADRQSFELGLVLGGTLSAGAYTAGALDFLLQALEAWHDAGSGRQPPHRVVLQTAAGSSGGAVCASILGLLCSRRVPHILADADPDPPGLAADRDPAPTGNPL